MTISNSQITDAGINYQRQRTVMDHIPERNRCPAFISVFIARLIKTVQKPVFAGCACPGTPSACPGLSVAATRPPTSPAPGLVPAGAQTPRKPGRRRQQAGGPRTRIQGVAPHPSTLASLQNPRQHLRTHVSLLPLRKRVAHIPRCSLLGTPGPQSALGAQSGPSRTGGANRGSGVWCSCSGAARHVCPVLRRAWVPPLSPYLPLTCNESRGVLGPPEERGP